MTKTQKLNDLFESWLGEFPKNRRRIHKDGIINEASFSKQKTKLLFISKEPNKKKPGNSILENGFRMM